MSSLPPSALSYEVVVSEYFLGLRGAGLMLSPLDLDEVRAWERRGLPVAVVCRGLKDGLEAALRDRPGATAPRALRAYRRSVEDAWRAYRGGRVGDAPPPPEEATAAAGRLRAARALLDAAPARGPVAGGVAAARRALAGEAATLAAVEAALEAADRALLRGWLLALPRPARSALGPRCRLLAGDRPPWTRPSAYRQALRAHLVDAAREAGLLRLSASV